MENEYKPRFTGWVSIRDELSTNTINITHEIINGQEEERVTMSGNLHNYEELIFTPNGYYSKIPWSGTYATFDEPTLAAIRTMKAFSFKALGDGNRYSVRLPTFETIETDHFYLFSAP